MITWMQRHKKYLIITIWISTIAFVGAGFVGWGQYQYGDKASAVARVGKIDITAGDLQKSYSNLYAQYSQMLQGNFDEEKAKSFGLKSQALQHLTQQALVLNLANAYKLTVSDAELLQDIRTKEYFFKDGVFNKDIYKDVLSKNNITIKEYEEDAKKELLIKKTLKLLALNTNENELKIMQTAINIADKLEYKVLTQDMIAINSSDEILMPYWEKKKKEFMNEASYDVNFIKQDAVKKEFTQAELQEHYAQNKTHYKGADAKIENFETAKSKVINELSEKESKKEALKNYIAYKKGLNSGLNIQNATLSQTKNPFNAQALKTVSELSEKSPFAKPVLVDGSYITFKLVKANKPQPKTFQEAKSEVALIYAKEQKKVKLQELAKSSHTSFSGKVTDFITGDDTAIFSDLAQEEAAEFLSKLFVSQKRRDFITLESGKVIMYNILEQKMLNKVVDNQNNPIIKLKNTMFNEGLVKNLQSRYKTEIFIQGL